jgi:hypothetical protein
MPCAARKCSAAEGDRALIICNDGPATSARTGCNFPGRARTGGARAPRVTASTGRDATGGVRARHGPAGPVMCPSRIVGTAPVNYSLVRSGSGVAAHSTTRGWVATTTSDDHRRDG